MTTYLLDILDRLNNDNYRSGEEKIDDTWESGKTVKYEAMLEVQKLSDESLLTELIQEFKANPKDSNASNMLFLISSIVTNTLNTSGMNFMYDLLLSKNNSFLSHCLGFYSSRVQLPKKYKIKPFIDLFNNRSQWIRSDSYGAVANSLHDEKESILLSRLSTLTKAYDIERLLLSLSRFCGKPSLTEVEKHLKSKSSRVRAAAKMCITSINVQSSKSSGNQLDNMHNL